MKTLRARLLATYLILIVISLGLFVWRAGALLDASRFAETRRDQEGRTILMASATEELLEKFHVGQIDAAALRRDVLDLAHEISQQVVIFDLDGRVLVDSAHPPDAYSDISKQPEVAAAFQGRVAYVIRYDPDDQFDALFTASPIRHDQNLLGVVRLELPMSAIQAASRQMWAMLAGAALLAAFATILVSLWFARTLVHPIAELTRAASAMANGELKQRVRATGPAELAQLAYAFNFMAQRVSRVMEDQRAFVANAAHELRTPLTTIRLRAEALREGAKDDPAVAAQFLADIESETERLSRLVEELLDLSRIETGLITPRREPVSVEAIAGAVADELHGRTAEAGLSLQLAMADNLPRVYADPDQIRQVFINLIGNAIKFTPPGGKIQVQSAVVQLDGGRWLKTQVCDTGDGISGEDLPHIFDRFYRSDKARERDPSSGSGGGAGLGLAIVKSIIDAHVGRVWAESEKGKGTTITFALPTA